MQNELDKRLADDLARRGLDHVGPHDRPDRFRTSQRGNMFDDRSVVGSLATEQQSYREREFVRPAIPKTCSLLHSLVRKSDPTGIYYLPEFPITLNWNGATEDDQLFLAVAPQPLLTNIKYTLLIDMKLTASNPGANAAQLDARPFFYRVRDAWIPTEINYNTRPGTPFSSGYTENSQTLMERRVFAGGGYVSPSYYLGFGGIPTRAEVGTASLTTGEAVTETSLSDGMGCMFVASPTSFSSVQSGFCLTLGFSLRTWTGQGVISGFDDDLNVTATIYSINFEAEYDLS